MHNYIGTLNYCNNEMVSLWYERLSKSVNLPSASDANAKLSV